MTTESDWLDVLESADYRWDGRDRFPHLTKRCHKARVLFFVLGIFLLAIKGDTVKRGAPVTIDQERVGARPLRRIAHARKRVFPILRRLTMSVGEHAHHPSRRSNWPFHMRY